MGDPPAFAFPDLGFTFWDLFGDLIKQILIAFALAAVIIFLGKKLAKYIYGKKERKAFKSLSYKEKFDNLTQSLNNSSEEIDTIIEDINKTATEREERLVELGVYLSLLGEREVEVENKIHASENLPLVATEHLSKLTYENEKSILYKEKFGNLTQSLKKSSKEIDTILEEFIQTSTEREKKLVELTANLSLLEEKELQTKEKISHLENTPLVVAEYFAKLTSVGEKKSAKRDYLLCAAGIVVSAIVGIIMKLLNWL